MMIIKIIYYFVKTIIIDLQINKHNFKDFVIKECCKVEEEKLFQYSETDIPKVEKKIQMNLIAIDKACLLFPGEAKCLHRAILQYRFVRGKLKLPATIVIGVKKFPFASHAWVQWKNTDRAICEADENLVGFSIIFNSDKLL